MPPKTITRTARQKDTCIKPRDARKKSPAHEGARKASAPQASQKKLRAAASARGPRPRVRLGDAMREKGLDEIAAARVMARFIREVSNKKPKDKLLLEALKEVFRVLEPVRTGDRAAPDAPVPVQLVHFVARPRESKPPVEAPEPAPTPSTP
jgi:hypothetical protein